MSMTLKDYTCVCDNVYHRESFFKAAIIYLLDLLVRISFSLVCIEKS